MPFGYKWRAGGGKPQTVGWKAKAGKGVGLGTVSVDDFRSLPVEAEGKDTL